MLTVKVSQINSEERGSSLSCLSYILLPLIGNPLLIVHSILPDFKKCINILIHFFKGSIVPCIVLCNVFSPLTVQLRDLSKSRHLF